MPPKGESWNCSVTIVTYPVTLERTVQHGLTSELSMDELQEVLENRMALLDAVPPDPPRLPKINPEVTKAKEDFPHNDE